MGTQGDIFLIKGELSRSAHGKQSRSIKKLSLIKISLTQPGVRAIIGEILLPFFIGGEREERVGDVQRGPGDDLFLLPRALAGGDHYPSRPRLSRRKALKPSSGNVYLIFSHNLFLAHY